LNARSPFPLSVPHGQFVKFNLRSVARFLLGPIYSIDQPTSGYGQWLSLEPRAKNPLRPVGAVD
jgi:hypothetical protein